MQRLHRGVYRLLALRIKGAGCLVKHQQAGAIIQRTGYGHTLALPPGEHRSAVTQPGIQTILESGKPFAQVGHFQTLQYPFIADFTRWHTESHIRPQTVIRHEGGLGHIADGLLP